MPVSFTIYTVTPPIYNIYHRFVCQDKSSLRNNMCCLATQTKFLKKQIHRGYL